MGDIQENYIKNIKEQARSKNSEDNNAVQDLPVRKEPWN